MNNKAPILIQPEFINVTSLISFDGILILIVIVFLVFFLTIRVYRLISLITLFKQLPDSGIKNTVYRLTSLPVYKNLVANNKIKQSYIAKLNDIKYKKDALTSNSEIRGIILHIALQVLTGRRNAR